MNIQLEDVSCPIGGSDNVRSKVHSEDEWWYKCYNKDSEHTVLLDHQEKTIDLTLFYFTRDGSKIETQYGTFHAE